MAKQIIHIGISVPTDGFLPSRSNIIGLAAVFGSLGEFNVNIKPPNGEYKESAFWKKHPVELADLKVGAVPLPKAMTNFREWLKQWQGNLIACCSSVDFWHLFQAMLETGKDCPFGSQPMDINSFYAGQTRKKSPTRRQNYVKPLDVARERWKLVSGEELPKFGKVEKEKPKIKNYDDWVSNNRNLSPSPTVPTRDPRANSVTIESYETFRERNARMQQMAAAEQQNLQMQMLAQQAWRTSGLPSTHREEPPEPDFDPF